MDKRKGGLVVMEKLNKEKAGILYDYIDSSKLFNSPVRREDRSLMNAPFVTGNDELDGNLSSKQQKRLKTT